MKVSYEIWFHRSNHCEKPIVSHTYANRPRVILMNNSLIILMNTF